MPVNFGIPVALEKRETEDSGDDGDGDGGGGGFPWIDDGDPTGKAPERKMKRYDKGAGYGRKEERDTNEECKAPHARTKSTLA